MAIPKNEAEESQKKQGIQRYFLNDDEILEFPEDGMYAISNQWGKGNIDNFLHCARKNGFQIEEVISKRERRVGVDIGEIVEERQIKMNNGDEFKIIRRDSNQIQIYKDSEQVIAKEILRRIINERNFEIPMTGLNTQQMGKRVLDNLRTD